MHYLRMMKKFYHEPTTNHLLQKGKMIILEGLELYRKNEHNKEKYFQAQNIGNWIQKKRLRT